MRLSIYILLVKLKNYNIHLQGKLEGEDIKAILQPVTELLSFLEVVDPSSICPITLNYGSRNTFRPFFYFKHYDVMLTTPIAVTYHLKQYLYLFGLLLMQVIFSLHEYQFSSEDVQGCANTGWKQKRNPAAYVKCTLIPDIPTTGEDPNISLPPIASEVELLHKGKRPRIN